MLYGMAGENKYTVFKEIVASLIHDLKNPLSAITLGLEYIQLNAEGRVPPDAIKGAMASAARIDQLLDAVSLYFQDDDTPPTAVPLSYIFGKARLLVGYYYSRRQIVLKSDEASSDRSLLLHFNKVFQGIVLLLVGLAKRVGLAGTVAVSMKEQDGWQTMILAIGQSAAEYPTEAPANADADPLTDACFELARGLFQGSGIEIAIPTDWTASTSVVLRKAIEAPAPAGGK